MERFVLESLLSQDQNISDGLGQFPDRVFNLVDDRRGGYGPFGHSVQYTGSSDTTQEGFGELIGYDAFGWSSFVVANGALGLRFAGHEEEGGNTVYRTVEEQPLNSSNLRPFEGRAVHIPQVGAWRNRESWFIRERRKALWTYGKTSLSALDAPTIEVIEDEDAHLEVGSYHIMWVYWLESHAGKFYYHHTVPQRVLITALGQGIRLRAPAHGHSVLNSEVFIFEGDAPNLNAQVAVSAALLAGGEPHDILGSPTGFSIGQNGRFVVPEFNPNCPVLAHHGGRTWGVAGENSRWYRRRGVSLGGVSFRGSANRTLLYTEPGWVNLMGPNNFRELTSTNSSKITGLLSLPGGLLIFMENEAHLLTGSEPPFNVRPVPGSVGCDEGVVPASQGSVAYTIWRGKLYALAGGNMQEVGRPQWLKNEQFTQVVVEPRTGHVVVANEEDRVFRFNPQTNFWFENTLTAGGFASETNDLGMLMLPSPLDEGTFYVTRSPDDFVATPGTVEPTTEEDETIEEPLNPHEDVEFGRILTGTSAPAARFDHGALPFKGNLGSFNVVRRWEDYEQRAAYGDPDSEYSPLLVEGGHRGQNYLYFGPRNHTDNIAVPHGSTLDAASVVPTLLGAASFSLAFVFKVRLFEHSDIITQPLFQVYRIDTTTNDFDEAALVLSHNVNVNQLNISVTPTAGGTTWSRTILSSAADPDDASAEPHCVVITVNNSGSVHHAINSTNFASTVPAGIGTIETGAGMTLAAGFGTPRVNNDPSSDVDQTDFDLYRSMVWPNELTSSQRITVMERLIARYRGS